MKKSLFFAIFAAAAVLLSGCSSTPTPTPESAPVPAPAAPEPAPAVPSTPLQEMQKTAAAILEAGGLAVVGTSESKSLELALDKAKVNGRIALARILATRLEALEKAFIEETGTPAEALILSRFSEALKVVKEQQIAGRVAQSLKYEAAENTFAAYALMVLDPKVIADQLAKEQDLFALLQTTEAFDELRREVALFEAFKAAKK